MTNSDASVQALRAALEHSPDNAPLRQHLADVLLGLNRADEAEQEYRRALPLAPDSASIKLGLAQAYYQLGKNTQALVVIEDVLRAAAPPARAYLLHARLLFRAGDVAECVRQYREAVDADPSTADAEFAQRLGVGADEEAEVVDGRVRQPVEEEAPPANGPVERPRVTFWDVGGMEPVKEEVRMKIIHPLAHPELYKAYGKTAGGGILLYGPPGCGKAQPLHSLVQTPFGPRRMGDIQLGDLVCTPDGSASRVLGIFPQGRRMIYRITFADGDSVEACGEHLWRVDRLHNGWSGKVVTTAYLADHLRSPCGDRLMSIRTPVPLSLAERPLPIPPYLLGLLLGDGGFTNTNVCFSTADAQLVQSVSGILNAGYVLKRGYRYCDFRIVKERRSGLPNRCTDELRALGLWGLSSGEKFIPPTYLYNSTPNRWELLRGLMDTDGTVEKTGRVVYHTVSPSLARGVKWLVESLGGIATVRVKPTTGQDCHHIGIRLRNAAEAFRLERKKARCRPRTKYFPCRIIDRVEPVGEQEAQCILIDHPDHLYLTDHSVATHNTHLARATAGEIKAAFIAVGINDILDMWIGQSERNLHEIFEQARRSRPCVLFFDEVDALGSNRSDMRHSGRQMLINQFLSEMDGIQASNEGVLVLAATNMPWQVDAAFRRPGRFDRLIFVPPPDAPARAAIFRILCRDKPVQEIDYDLLSKRTEHFSGADLKGVLDRAVEAKLREAIKDGVLRPLTTRDLTAAAAEVKPSTREWFATARNHALFANQGGVYDDILKYLKQ